MRSIIGPVSREPDVPKDLSRRRATEFKVVMAVAAAWAVLASGTAYVIHKRVPLPAPAPRIASAAALDTVGRAQMAPVPVRFTNPFDPAEVFEFPPGTGEADARQAVAQMLLERARERLGYVRALQRTAAVKPATRG